jgi:hypothetical protein
MIMRSIILGAFFLLAACAGPIETRVDSAGMETINPATFVVSPDTSSLVANAQAKVAMALAERGYSPGQVGELNLQVTLSDRPAMLALQSGSQTLSPAAGKKRCTKREYRLGITLTRIADGAQVYRASAAEFHCKLGAEDVLGNLVEAALADLGSPRGAYVIKRPR